MSQAFPKEQFVDGYRIPVFFSAEAFRSAVSYKPRSDDVFIATYPKCGTTWSQHILLLIFRHGVPMESAMEFFCATPFLDMTGSKSAETMLRPGAIKVHLPFHLAPWSEKAKYIYVARNPKDCCVSYYHHMKSIPGYLSGSFDDFFETFISGKIDYEDYFDHVMGWYEHRNDPNVLFVTYEEMKEDPEASILKMASFIDDEMYAKPLREDPQKLGDVVKYSSFNHMKEVVNKSMDDLFSMPKEDVMSSILPEEMKQMLLKIDERLGKPKEGNEKPSPSNFIRKGIIGDWRNYFSTEQSKRMDEKFAERMKGTEIAELWEKYM